ncbi:hypothetical protein K474DRAFT_1610336 [Panus rudis PR-1116 ss-1]|nr:hypothetical protein K474DRAFT_1610336 [Panus rudis PR-1116 ss-1]
MDATASADDWVDDVLSPDDGWCIGSVDIPVPCEKVRKPENEADTFRVNGIHYRKLTHVIKEACEDPSSKNFHYIPFQEYWKHDSDSARYCRIFSEIYNSDAMLEEDAKLRAEPRQPEDAPDVEYAIIAMLPYSDSTRLANFGKASLWPIYMFFGNQSKYFRGRPSAFAAHHVAYLPTLPDDFQDHYQAWFKEVASEETLRFCRKELFHAVWLLLMDEEFMHAYVHGMLVRCGDGIIRRLFPRFFCYLADYPEKVLVACVKFLAECPCPRCEIKKIYISSLATTADYQRRSHIRVDTPQLHATISSARYLIFNGGLSAASKRVKDILSPKSLLPTRSAFSTRLAEHGFNVYRMLVPDLLHDVELGAGRDIIVHLVRVLYAEGGSAIQMFNERYDIPCH